MQNVKDLKVRTKRFALDVIGMYSALPKTTVAQVIGKQVLRSGTSVGANYREAYRGRSTAEFIAKMGDCLKELDESVYWFELLSAAKGCLDWYEQRREERGDGVSLIICQPLNQNRRRSCE
jgi:four helix bundle protein